MFEKHFEHNLNKDMPLSVDNLDFNIRRDFVMQKAVVFGAVFHARTLPNVT
jgi:hypothetical protein